mgnify:CR=1 FL=1
MNTAWSGSLKLSVGDDGCARYSAWSHALTEALFVRMEHIEVVPRSQRPLS